jgi:pyruvate ferredoxin oxidoreductase gamma subunit
MEERFSIRMSGLGGQGVVTAAHLIGMAASADGKESAVNPFFGAEKRLAPAESYVRISNMPIHERGEILYPDIIMIFHAHVVSMGKSYTMPFYDGLKQGGIVLLNAEGAHDIQPEDMKGLQKLKARIFYVPATRIAIDLAGTDLSSNLAMVGGLLGVVKLVSQDALRAAIQERFGGGKFIASGTTAALDDVLKSKFDKISQLVDKNMEVIEKAALSVTEYIYEGQAENIAAAKQNGSPKAALIQSARVNQDLCIGCKRCLMTCPDPNVILYHKAKKKAEVVEIRCKACGLCVAVCPKEAIKIDYY